MSSQTSTASVECPVTSDSVRQDLVDHFLAVMRHIEKMDMTFFEFEKFLRSFLAKLACMIVRLFLTVRHERLDVTPHLQEGRYREGEKYSERTLKTPWGEVRYGRCYLIKRAGGSGFFPLDRVLGLTQDRLSPWLMQWVARLATRMSFKAARMVCEAALNWAPATETIEQVVLGMGRQAQTYMKYQSVPIDDGEVLVIEIDGKCAPTATAEELEKRKKTRRCCKGKSCGCQRHRGRASREARGSKKRRKKGDKSKHGKEVMVVVMYTLKKGTDGLMHGPRNKKLYATFEGRGAAALWARMQATKRGFPKGTSKTVQVICDGASGLKSKLQVLFPEAIFTLDVMHIVERLWSLGHRFHAEGSQKLKRFVEKLKNMVYEGRTSELVDLLKKWKGRTSKKGPGNAGRREELQSLIGYLETRLEMTKYAEWMEQDLVIASGQVEGAVRYLVGERFDCSGMRWVPGKAQALLHLRCIELNGDWNKFNEWFQRRIRKRLEKTDHLKILTDEAIPLKIEKE